MDKKQKAQLLFDKYFLLTANAIDDNGSWVVAALNKSLAKQCACIAIDQMIEFKESLFFGTGSLAHQYLLEIKEEIEKI